MIKLLTIVCAVALSQSVKAESLLVKLAAPSSTQKTIQIMNLNGLKAAAVSDQWIEVSGNIKLSQFKSLLEKIGRAHV